ncbi:hypothetical protein E2C01_077147 [Portunus trituberculatus]|uniref:Uncharacterized protein n=1 Tax=Portunus trituberculatus TaxID=210409 RepID=A0A5B7INT4_PORTR|nr:hypothetical protein [Portunus trituberculatus]
MEVSVSTLDRLTEDMAASFLVLLVAYNVMKYDELPLSHITTYTSHKPMSRVWEIIGAKDYSMKRP